MVKNPVFYRWKQHRTLHDLLPNWTKEDKIMKQPKKSDKAQRIAASILTAFMFAETMDEVHTIWKNIYEEFSLYDDPFTHCPCSPKEFEENSLEYNQQMMEKRHIQFL